MALQDKPKELREYQEATRLLDKAETAYNTNASKTTRAQLDAAKKLYDEKSTAYHQLAQVNVAAQTAYLAKENPPPPPDELASVKKALKEAGQKLKELREENKGLHESLRQNIAEKKKYNYEILPALRKRKKQLEAER